MVAVVFCAIAITTIDTLATSNNADARQGTRIFTCSAVRNLVDSRGSVVLNTKNERVYRRSVRDRTQCELVEDIQRISVATRYGGCSLKISSEPLEDTSR